MVITDKVFGINLITKHKVNSTVIQTKTYSTWVHEYLMNSTWVHVYLMNATWVHEYLMRLGGQTITYDTYLKINMILSH